MLFRALPVFAAAMLTACGQSENTSEHDDRNVPMPTEAEVSAKADAETAVSSTPPKAFAQCGACHSVEADRNIIGPSLASVYGAKAGHVGDFAYSKAMREAGASGLTWNDATLNSYLENPRAVVPGTSMSYAGMRNPQKRAEIIAYLKTL